MARIAPPARSPARTARAAQARVRTGSLAGLAALSLAALSLAALLVLAPAVRAQAIAPPPPADSAAGVPAAETTPPAPSTPAGRPEASPSQPEFPQLSLTAGAWREVVQDRVVVTLSASHEGLQPGPAQARVNELLTPVLEQLRKRSDLEVETAGFRTDAIWKDSRIVAWRARGAIRLTATPSEAFNQLIGELASQLNVDAVAHFLSREARLAVEQALIGEAVEAFRGKAQAAAQALGYRGWTIRSVSVNDSGPGHPEPMPKMMMSRGAAAAEAAPMPIVEGRTTVSVSVGGTVVLQR